MPKESTVSPLGLDKFGQHAEQWWDIHGPLKTLHVINPTRLEFIANNVAFKDKRILDVGCGAGILSESMARAGAQVTAIDAEPSLIEAAKAHALRTKLAITYQCTPIEEFEVKEGFDAITCMELLEHVENPELVVQHCKRLLKPQGVLFLSTLNRTPKSYVSAIIGAEYILGLLPKQTHNYQQFIKPSELWSIARSLDFELLTLQGMSYNPFTRKATLEQSVQVNYLMALRNSD